MVKYLFWNINKKNLVYELSELVWKEGIDIIMAAEAENLDVQYFLSRFEKSGKIFEKKEIVPKQNGILLLANANLTVSVYKEEKHFSAYKVHEKGKNYLLVVTHLTSAMYYSELARNQRANDLAKMIEKLETACNEEAEKEGKKNCSVIVVGDFNLHPFSAGIIGQHGFHAIMDADRAQKKSRAVNGCRVKFYYNPMWNLMGKRDNPLGTYYFDSDQNDNSFYWYTFDQVLLRPELIKAFVWEEFEIISHIGKSSLLKNNKIHSKKYSDHLPVKFAINQEEL